jgi:hypothetical protein
MKQRTLLHHQYEGKGTIFFCGTKKFGDSVVKGELRKEKGERRKEKVAIK